MVCFCIKETKDNWGHARSIETHSSEQIGTKCRPIKKLISVRFKLQKLFIHHLFPVIRSILVSNKKIEYNEPILSENGQKIENSSKILWKVFYGILILKYIFKPKKVMQAS